MLWTDHTWLECTITLSEKKNTHTRWSFENTILLSEVQKEEIAQDIKEHFQLNESEQMPLPMLWDAMKAVVRGKAISVASAMKRQRREQQWTLLEKIIHLEQLHKRRGGKRLYAKLQAERRALDMLDTKRIQRNLLYLKQRSWRNSPKALRALARRVRDQRLSRMISQLKTETGKMVSSSKEILDTMAKFYSNLCTSSNPAAPDIANYLRDSTPTMQLTAEHRDFLD